MATGIRGAVYVNGKITSAADAVVPVYDQRSFDAALSRLLGEPDLRRRFGQAARARCAARFTIDAVAPSWLRVLEECSER